MDYTDFRTQWHKALQAAGLWCISPYLSETLNVEQQCRMYQITITPYDPTSYPYTLSASFQWEWDAVLAARFATTEEDLLMTLMGQAAYDTPTHSPWLRISATLGASWPWAGPLPWPSPSGWRAWVTAVTRHVTPHLPCITRTTPEGEEYLSGCGEPEVRAHCAADGTLFLTGVSLTAWQSIDLPRQWDDPVCPRDPEPDAALLAFTRRVRQAFQAWEMCLANLDPRGKLHGR